MNNTFQSYDLTDDQAALLEKLESFLSSSGGGCFLLKGSAGTGKTFMLKGLTDHLSIAKRPFKLMAPTGRAAKVITQKTAREATTIHKVIYRMGNMREYLEKDIKGTETFKYYFNLANNGDDANTVYIVDEASMVSDEYSEAEFVRFGSGRLLRDLLAYINLDHNDHQKKVVFIGDAAQLPPVKAKTSPALDREYLANAYDLSVCEHELAEVVRQRSGSGILGNATLLRKKIAAAKFNELDIDTSLEDVTPVSSSNLLDVYLKACADQLDDRTIIIAHSNRQVKEYNELVRTHFFPGSESITTGDKVLIVHNNYWHEIPLLNGDFGQVLSVSNSVENRKVFLNKPEDGKRVNVQVELAFRDIVVQVRDLQDKPHDIQCKINENLLHSGQPGLSSDERKAMYVDFKNRHPLLKAGTKEFREAIMDDPYFNCLQVKFGYAVTCHKAQGGEWGNVIVDFETTWGYLNEGNFRWTYTAITRAQSHLYTMKEPHFGILSPSKPAAAILQTAGKNVIVVKDEADEMIPFDMPEDQPFLKAILAEVSVLVRDTGVRLDQIIHNNYCEHYCFSRAELTAEIMIYYKDKQAVSRILARPESDKQMADELIALLSCLEGKKFVVETSSEASKTVTVTFPTGAVYLEEFFTNIEERVAGTGIHILEVAHPSKYHAKYIYSRSGLQANVNYYFNGKGSFTRVIPDQNLTTSIHLLQQVIDFTQ